MRLSKSRYVTGLQCPKILWMNEHMPEQFDESVLDEGRLETGNVVGDLAMGYYGDFVEIEFDEHGFEAMAEKTRELLEAGERVICEATFIHDDNFCMADILLVEEDGLRIVEVKSGDDLCRLDVGAAFEWAFGIANVLQLQRTRGWEWDDVFELEYGVHVHAD